MKARCSGCGCSTLPSPSMVVMSLPAMDHSGVSHAATARSSTMTLQAPHSLAPHPKCGPVMPSCPRRISSSERSGSASISVSTPLRRKRTRGIEKKDLDSGLILLGLVGEFLDDFGPFHNIAAQIFVELLRGHRHRNRALVFPELDDVRPPDHLVNGGIQLVDNRLWRSCWRHQSKPDGRLVTGA